MTNTEKMKLAQEIVNCEKILSGKPNFIQKAAATRKIETIAAKIPTPRL